MKDTSLVPALLFEINVLKHKVIEIILYLLPNIFALKTVSFWTLDWYFSYMSYGIKRKLNQSLVSSVSSLKTFLHVFPVSKRSQDKAWYKRNLKLLSHGTSSLIHIDLQDMTMCPRCHSGVFENIINGSYSNQITV